MAEDVAKYRDAVLRRYQAAKDRRQKWDGVLNDVYSMVAPMVDVTGNRPEGTKADVTLYSDQGLRSLRERKSRMHGQLWPVGEVFWETEFPGIDPSKLPPDVQPVYTGLMDANTQALAAAIDASNFHIEIDQLCTDLLVSTAAIQVNGGDPDDMPLLFEALPISQLVPEESHRGLLENVFRPREVRMRDVAEIWPDAKLPESDDWKSKVEKEPEAKVKVLEAQLWNPKGRNYDYYVFLPEYREHLAVRRVWNKRRIIVARMHRNTGNLLGSGPAMDCRASMMTANKVVELVLKNATVAVTGIWQADDDGVLNPAAVKLVPGTIIPKAPGSAGLQPLAAPGRFDVSSLVLTDLHKAIAECIAGPPRPGYDQSRPVAQEFIDARQRHAEVEVPQHSRIFLELDQPLCEAVIDILSEPKYLGTPYHVRTFAMEERTMRPRPVNPLMRIRRQAKASEMLQAYAFAAQLDPQTTPMLVKRPLMIDRVLRESGFPADLLEPPQQVDQVQQMMARMQEAMQQAYTKGMEAGARGAAAAASTEDGNAALQNGLAMMDRVQRGAAGAMQS